MGTFNTLWGDPTIPEEKLPEFIRRASVILDQGGMMLRTYRQIGRNQIPILKPPGPVRPYLEFDQTWKDLQVYDYNFFEQDGWEDGSLNTRTGKFVSNKVGWSFFCGVTHAVDVLREFYSATPCIAGINDDLVAEALTIGWFNHLFGEKWNNMRSRLAARLFAWDPSWTERYEDDPELLAKLREPDDPDFSYNGVHLNLIRQRNEDAITKLAATEPPDIIFSLTEMLHSASEAVKEFQEEGGTLSDLCEELEEVDPDDKEAGGRKEVLLVRDPDLPLEPMLDLLRNLFEPSDEEMDRVRELLAPHMKTLENYGKAELEFPDRIVGTVLGVPCEEVTTERFLASFQYYSVRTPYEDLQVQLQSRMRAYWWRPDGDVHFEDEEEERFAEWHRQMDRDRQHPTPRYFATMQLLQTSLGQAVEQYRHPFFFETAWDEFLERLDDPFVSAAVRQMERIRTGDPEKANIDLAVFCSMLANRELRQREFGF